MQSVPITTKVVSSNFAPGDVYLIQHYVIKFVSDLRMLVVFSGYSFFTVTLHEMNADVMNYWLQRFIVEARRRQRGIPTEKFHSCKVHAYVIFVKCQ